MFSRDDLRRARAAAAIAAYSTPTTSNTSRYIQNGQVTYTSAHQSLFAQSVPLLPRSTSFPSAPTLLAPGQVATSSESPKSAPAQPKQTILEQFLHHKEKLASLLLQDYAPQLLGEQCSCGADGATRTTRCRECWYYTLTCPTCFVQSHKHLPTHWAEVWNHNGGYFVRHDISVLPGRPFIQLGHGGNPCPCSLPDSLKHDFIIVDTNGIHSTRLRFCTCHGAEDSVSQLMKARLFPATFEKPKTAFTFAVLKMFEIQHLQAAVPLYDFVAALRQLTDRVFFDDTADPYDQFRDVFKMWRLLKAEQASGHHHDIDVALSSRPRGCLTVRCPACPELGVNVSGSVEYPSDMRHLNQIRLTADGNFRANHLAKTSEASNISYFEGRAYFPDTQEYKKYMERTSSGSGEKTECSFLKAVNKQDKKKFLGSDISGVVNIQCAHTFILSSVDLELGEKFASTDYSLVHAILTRFFSNAPHHQKFFMEDVDWVLSYDISCAYCVHLPVRVLAHFTDNPKLHAIISKFRFLIPLLHIQNHTDNCMYQYSCAYTSEVGHYHGEQAEGAWPYINLFSGQGRQMSHGNRHDLYAGAYGHWNLMKLLGLASQLYNEITRAKLLRATKRDSFFGLCDLYKEKTAEWNTLDRNSRLKGSDGEVRCVYRQSSSKVPSQAQVYRAMIESSDVAGPSSEGTPSTAQTHQRNPNAKSKSRKGKASRSTARPETKSTADKIPVLCNMSINIRKLQDQILCKSKVFEKHPTDRNSTDVNNLRERLAKEMKVFRELQVQVVPQLQDRILNHSALSVDCLEKQNLVMPSDLTETERTLLSLVDVSEVERRLLEGAAYDRISRMRTCVRFVSALASDKKANHSGQNQLTRATTKVEDASNLLDFEITFYGTLRTCLLNLGMPEDDQTFRPIDLASTRRTQTHFKRELGATYVRDGELWSSSTQGPMKRQTFHPLINPQGTGDDVVATQSSKGSKRKNRVATNTSSKKLKTDDHNAPSPNADIDSGSRAPDDPSPVATDPLDTERGWIWNLAPPKGLTDKEVEDWIHEGDRVQWFRSEAEMWRWQEEWEQKVVELARAVRFYDKMAKTWSELARPQTAEAGTDTSHQNPDGRSCLSDDGKASYARRAAARWLELSKRAMDVLKQAIPDYAGTAHETDILRFVVAERNSVKALISRAISKYSRTT